MWEWVFGKIDADADTVASKVLRIVVVTAAIGTRPSIRRKGFKGVFRGFQRVAVISRGSFVGESVRNRGVLDIGNHSDGEERFFVCGIFWYSVVGVGVGVAIAIAIAIGVVLGGVVVVFGVAEMPIPSVGHGG